ncbi:flagellar motor switch protein FliN [Clostridium sp. W14A]|nr:flagellar motor switch protein FliN [Clostridium sp. W14A]
MEIDAIGEILNISLGSSATSVSELLGQPVNITTPEVRLMKTSEFDIKTYEPAIAVEINYVQGLSGKNLLILKESDVKVIVGLLFQTDFSKQEFVMDEMNVGAICEVMNQMMGAAATALSQFLNRSINISPPNSFQIDNSEQFKAKYFEDSENICAVYFNLMIGDIVNSEFINVMPIPLAKELVSNFGLSSAPEDAAAAQTAQTETPAAVEAPEPAPQAAQAPAPAPVAQAAQPAPAESQFQQPQQPAQQTPPLPVDLNIKSAVYPSFDEQEPTLTKGETNNLNMIMSVPLQVTVEIGRTSKKIKDILDFSTGTIVELDKQAGSQVDVYVNGQAIAKGNVVVVDDFYGVRITEVINSDEIMKLV